MRWPHKTSLPPLNLDYQEPGGRARWATWALLLLAIVYMADVGWSYFRVKETMDRRMAELASLPKGARTGQTPSYRPGTVERELAFARATIHKIALPWNEFFKALSTSNVEDVDLLSVEPNIDSGTVQVTAEAKDLPAMLTYLARLESNKHFRSVGVTHHEIKRNDPLRRVSFTVVVSWRYKS